MSKYGCWFSIILICGLNCIDVPADEDAFNCVVCHGTDVQGNPAIRAPNLAVLPAWYLGNQITAFSNRWRHHGLLQSDGNDMSAALANMSAQQIQQAIDEIATIKTRPVEQTISGDVNNGKQLYHSCAQCHGDRAQGDQRVHAPPLAGQQDWYLARQLLAYLEGSRGYHPDDIDGKVMLESVSQLSSEKDINDVVAYIHSIK